MLPKTVAHSNSLNYSFPFIRTTKTAPINASAVQCQGIRGSFRSSNYPLPLPRISGHADAAHADRTGEPSLAASLAVRSTAFDASRCAHTNHSRGAPVSPASAQTVSCTYYEQQLTQERAHGDGMRTNKQVHKRAVQTRALPQLSDTNRKGEGTGSGVSSTTS